MTGHRLGKSSPLLGRMTIGGLPRGPAKPEDGSSWPGCRLAAGRSWPSNRVA